MNSNNISDKKKLQRYNSVRFIPFKISRKKESIIEREGYMHEGKRKNRTNCNRRGFD